MVPVIISEPFVPLEESKYVFNHCVKKKKKRERERERERERDKERE